MEEIKEKLNTVFRKVFKDDSIEVNEEMTANDVDKWDSLTHLEMVAMTEEDFGVKFKLRELVAMKNVGDFIVCIQGKIA